MDRSNGIECKIEIMEACACCLGIMEVRDINRPFLSAIISINAVILVPAENNTISDSQLRVNYSLCAVTRGRSFLFRPLCISDTLFNRLVLFIKLI